MKYYQQSTCHLIKKDFDGVDMNYFECKSHYGVSQSGSDLMTRVVMDRYVCHCEIVPSRQLSQCFVATPLLFGDTVAMFDL